MPQLKPVPSLQELCIRCISSNIDIWCYNRYEKKNSRRLKLTIDDNIVSRLPNVILNDICTQMMREIHFRPHHLNSIINEYTHNLDFSQIVSRSREGLCRRGVKLMRNICTNITSLNLSNNDVPCGDLGKLAKSLPSIEHLNLQLTNTDNTVLRILGNNSPNLRELDIRECWVTDDGINSLCIPNCGPKKYWPGGKCRLIEKLYISATTNRKYTINGIREVLLNLPFLREIDYNKIVRIFENIYTENRLQQFRLENINIKIEMSDMEKIITDRTLLAALSMCPNVVKANVVIKSDYRMAVDVVKWLPRIAEFRQLQELSIKVKPLFREFLHYRQIAPTLRLMGSNLKSLTLVNVAAVSLWDIGNNCPLLTKLHLYLVYITYSSSASNSKGTFGELRELTLSCIPNDQLRTLLTNCMHLQVLNFRQCLSLTDELILWVFQRNLFSELHTFKIEYCKNIHASSVLFLITHCKCLKQVTCFRCTGIEDSQLDELREMTRKENFDVTISKCNCDADGEHCCWSCIFRNRMCNCKMCL